MTKGISQRRINTVLLVVSLFFILPACSSGVLPKESYFKEVHTVSVPHSDELSVYVVIGSSVVGSTANAPGLGHYTEHLVWHNILNETRNNAVHKTNAWTSSDSIVYWLSGSVKDLDRLLRIISGVFNPITIERRFAKTEREIVLREYDLRLRNNLDGRVEQQINAFLYQGNSSEYSVLGSPSDIGNLTYDQAKYYHEKTHVQERAVLIVVGDVSDHQVRDAIKNSGIEKLEGTVHSESKPKFSLNTSAEQIFYYQDENSTPRMKYRKVVALDESVEFELLAANTAVLERMLDSNLPGGIAGPLRFDEFIARNFSFQVFPIDEKHLEIRFEGIPDQGVSLEELKEKFILVLNASANGFTQTTFDRVRSRFTGYWPNWKDDREANEWMASYVVNRVSNLKQSVSRKALEGIDKQISLKWVNKLLKALTSPGREATAYINPRGE